MKFSRRALVKASAASVLLGGFSAPSVARGETAEFSYKYANNLPDSHPLNTRAKEMAAAIKAETNGKFDLQIFPGGHFFLTDQADKIIKVLDQHFLSAPARTPA